MHVDVHIDVNAHENMMVSKTAKQFILTQGGITVSQHAKQEANAPKSATS